VSDVAREERRWERPPKPPGGAGRVFAWIAILGLAGLAIVLLCERNENRYGLSMVDGQLVVKKGIYFPVGARAWAPPDPRLAPAYAPVAPPPGFTMADDRFVRGREELDQMMFDLLARWGDADVASGDPERLQRGVGYVARAELLPGLSASQREELDHLRAEAGFHEGRDLVGRAGEELRRARERLSRTASSASSHAGEAAEAVRALDIALEALGRATSALRGTARTPPPVEAFEPPAGSDPAPQPAGAPAPAAGPAAAPGAPATAPAGSAAPAPPAR
jgi:hypothetical protein